MRHVKERRERYTKTQRESQTDSQSSKRQEERTRPQEHTLSPDRRPRRAPLHSQRTPCSPARPALFPDSLPASAADISAHGPLPETPSLHLPYLANSYLPLKFKIQRQSLLSGFLESFLSTIARESTCCNLVLSIFYLSSIMKKIFKILKSPEKNIKISTY